MSYLRNSLFFVAALTLAACAGMKPTRHVRQFEALERYRASLNTTTEVKAEQLCVTQGAMNSWVSLDFTPSTTVAKLPSGLTTTASCVSVPAGARALELRSEGGAWAGYNEMLVVHPSLQFLGNEFELIKDLPKPRLSASESLLSGLGLSGITVLTNDLASARYVVVYVHPSSFDGEIKVLSAYKGEGTPVPFTPYGPVKLRFR